MAAFPKDLRDWQAPPMEAPDSVKMGWLREQNEESENWMKGQAAYRDIPLGLDLVAGKRDPYSTLRSNLHTNYGKFLIRKTVSVLSDARIITTYRSDSKYLKKNAAMMTKIVDNVAREGQFSARLRQTLQYMSIGACGYLWPMYRKTRYGLGEPRIEFEPMGLLDVLPVQLPANNNLQEAYTATLCRFMPIAEAHAKFPAFQSSLLPIARRRYSSTVSGRRLDLAERFRYGDVSDEHWANLYTDIRYTFVHDVTINSGDRMMPMGDPGSTWEHIVPYLGQRIPKGVNVLTGQMEFKDATPEDCLMYPTMRCMIWSPGMRRPMYDGVAFDNHGMIPAAKYCCDDWPWESCGFSIAHDIHSAAKTMSHLERGIDQVARQRLDPALGYDRSAGLNDTTAMNLDVFEDRKRLGVDGDPSKVIGTLVPKDLLEVSEWIFKFVVYLKEQGMDAQIGYNEMASLAEAKLNMGTEGLEKALSLVGPLVKDIAFGVENATDDIGEMLKFMIPQYYTTTRVMQMIGPDKISEEIFDYDPETLIPSHGADEMIARARGVVIPERSFYSKLERLRNFCRNLRLMRVPHTMHDLTQMQEQLKYLQLQRGGFPIAPHDVAAKLNIENYGEIDGDTGFDRWVNWKKIELELMAKAQQLAQSLMPQGAQQPGAGPGGGQKGSGGRPPSGQKAPRIKQKGGEGGPRTTVTES